METEDKFKNSPIHDKSVILELMDRLEPKEMLKVVDFIQEQLEPKKNNYLMKLLPSDSDIEKESEFYATHIEFPNDCELNEKGQQRVIEWCKQDFVAGAKYIQIKLEENILK